jgi:hypothetical protein
VLSTYSLAFPRFVRVLIKTIVWQHEILTTIRTHIVFLFYKRKLDYINPLPPHAWCVIGQFLEEKPLIRPVCLIFF